MRILIITDYLPYPPISGDRIRVYNLIRRVAMKHQVALAAPIRTLAERNSISHLHEFCYKIETANLPRRLPVFHAPGLLCYGLAGKPLELKFLFSKTLAEKIRQLAFTQDFDIVQIEHSRMALYLEALPQGARCKRILVFHNIASYQYDRIFHIEKGLVNRMRALLHSRMMHHWEPQYAERFDRCITTSEFDRHLLMEANSHLTIDVVPNGVDTQRLKPLVMEEMQPALLFIGTMNYTPCADAVLYFCKQMLPHIRRVLAEVQVWIVGADPSPEVIRLNGDNVHVTGRVEDVVPYYRRSAVFIVPLRAGGGTRLKILEAMALGRPVVSTSIGCEGLNVVDGQHLLIADSPKQFAEQTIRLLTDKLLYQRIIAEARQLVVAKYDWDGIAGQLMDIYSNLQGN